MMKEKHLRSDFDYVQRKVRESSSEHQVAASSDTGAIARDSAVQRRALGGDNASTESVHQVAAQGIASPATALPHADRIQASFGAHDISHVRAHVGGDSAAAMGATAYAAGNDVVFDQPPDLHTAAHEAAHVVQQRGGVQLYGGVSKTGDGYERAADEVADHVVAGKSAEHLLGSPVGDRAEQGAVQRKEAPTQQYADQSVMHAIQAHVRLAASRMHAGGAKIRALLKSPNNTMAGNAPMLDAIQSQVLLVENDLDNVYLEIARVPKVMQAALDVELGQLNGAFHESWAPALGSFYSYSHDADGNERADTKGMQVSVSGAQHKIAQIFSVAGVDPQNVRSTLAPGARDRDPAALAEQRDEELQAAELEALKSGMYSVEVATELVKADLHSSNPDLGKQATDLAVSVQQLVNVLEPISPDHIGKVSKLPILIKQVEALQAEIAKMSDAGEEKGKVLAGKIGYKSQLSINLRRLKDKIAAINAYHKPKRR